jgi:polyadenylation factor subunit 2
MYTYTNPAIAWHPIHENLFVSGGWEGSINFWLTDDDTPVASMENAHESSVFALDWHPLGHILVSGSNDHTTRFWTRNRPGEALNDQFNMSELGEFTSAAAENTDVPDMSTLV